MNLPFTVSEFFGVFRSYNEALWPAQALLLALGLAAMLLVRKPHRRSGLIISVILTFLWAWIAVAYHLVFFSRINPLAYVFAGVSLAGAAIFLGQGVFSRRLQFEWVPGVRRSLGVGAVAFALVIYPAWSWFAGHPYPSMPTFGLPCPTTIFTIGLLAFLATPHPRIVYVVPILWCFVGAQAAFLLDVPQDLGLLVAGVVGVWLLSQATTAVGVAHAET